MGVAATDPCLQSCKTSALSSPTWAVRARYTSFKKAETGAQTSGVASTDPNEGASFFHSFVRSQQVTGLCGHAAIELPDLKLPRQCPVEPD